jgi:hypothetical protein
LDAISIEWPSLWEASSKEEQQTGLDDRNKAAKMFYMIPERVI